jgi:hypothetical protein
MIAAMMTVRLALSAVAVVALFAAATSRSTARASVSPAFDTASSAGRTCWM